MDEDVIVKLESPQSVYGVVVLVIGRFGIAYQTLHDCYGDKSCQMLITATKDMIPEAKVVAYSIEHYDRQILFGSAKIYFDTFSENFVSIRLKLTIFYSFVHFSK